MSSDNLPHVRAEEIPASETDFLAKREVLSISQGTYEEEDKKNRHRRRQSILSHFHRCLIAGFYVVAVSGGVTFLVFTYHLISPAGWHFLDQHQLTEIQDLFFKGFAGAIFGFIAAYLRGHLGG